MGLCEPVIYKLVLLFLIQKLLMDTDYKVKQINIAIIISCCCKSESSQHDKERNITVQPSWRSLIFHAVTLQDLCRPSGRFISCLGGYEAFYCLTLCLLDNILVKWIAKFFCDAVPRKVQLIKCNYLPFLMSLTPAVS